MSSIHITPLISLLTQLKDHLIEIFHLPEVEDDTIWEDDRNEFLKSIEIEKVNVKSNIR